MDPCRRSATAAQMIAAGDGYEAIMSSTLVRPRDSKWIAGVCAGVARRFGVSTGLVRIGFVIFGLVGVGELAYIALWIVIPKA